jgi:hypothetical protein
VSAGPSRARAVAVAVVAGIAALLCGCVEAEEAWTLDGRGAGTYALTVRWDASLVARVGAIVGGEALRRLEGRGFPLREEAVRESLEGLDGVAVEEVAVTDLDGGRRELRARVRFRRIADLLAWEVFARRAVRVQRSAEEATWAMDPLAHVPVLGPLVEFARTRGLGAAAGEGAEDEASPLARLGVREEDAELLGTMLRPHLQAVRFRFRVRTPGPVTSAFGRTPEEETSEAAGEVSFADLVAGRDRRVRVAWRPRSLDAVPLVEHPGDPPATADDPRR